MYDTIAHSALLSATLVYSTLVVYSSLLYYGLPYDTESVTAASTVLTNQLASQL